MLKSFKTPSVKIVYLDEADVIVTSPDRSLSVNTSEDVDDADKARSRSIWGDD